jgi:hypothetical protein
MKRFFYVVLVLCGLLFAEISFADQSGFVMGTWTPDIYAFQVFKKAVLTMPDMSNQPPNIQALFQEIWADAQARSGAAQPGLPPYIDTTVAPQTFLWIYPRNTDNPSISKWEKRDGITATSNVLKSGPISLVGGVNKFLNADGSELMEINGLSGAGSWFANGAAGDPMTIEVVGPLPVVATPPPPAASQNW